MRTFLRTCLLVASALVVVGCATSRGVMEVETVVDENPATGQAVTFTRVSDNREFFVAPPQADMPSLKGGEIYNEAITSRAIARKRNGFGQAMGDILLPEGESAAGLVEAMLTDAFRDSGYRVVTESDPDFSNATPLEVDIGRFWGWFQPGFWQIKLHFDTEITLHGPLGPFAEGHTYENFSELGVQVASEKNWLAALQDNLDATHARVVADLAP